MLEYYNQFIYTILGDGSFYFLETDLVVDLMALCLISLTFFLIVRFVLNVFKFCGGLIK